MNQCFRTLALAAAALLAGCSAQPGAPEKPSPPLAGARLGGPLDLVDQDGRRVSERDFAGQYRVIYFGYTYCPDVCPTDLQKVAGALKLLERDAPALARRVTPIFVTVDPERDRPAQVKQFVRAFHPRIVGLTGTPAEIAKVEKDFAIFAQKQPGTSPGSYLMEHSTAVYLFDPAGKPLAVLPNDKGPEEIAVDIKRWAA